MDDYRVPDEGIIESMPAQGKPLSKEPPRILEFYELEKKTIDTLIEAVKYFTTTAGIALSLYAQLLSRFTNSGLKSDLGARFLSFLPLLLWLTTIVGGVIAIFPRSYTAKTDFQKEQAVKKVRKKKRFWVLVTVSLFISGFIVTVYMLAAELWNLYPFK